jgi:hypothetical protein
MSLSGVRRYRQTLTTEESRVSYWRRILQARLDLVRAVMDGQSPGVDGVRGLLADGRLGGGRLAMVEITPTDDLPPLPDLAELWLRDVVDGDHRHNQALAHDLAKAERELSAYRAALHRRLAAATGELIARYREDPLQCLSALPLQSAQPRRAVRA